MGQVSRLAALGFLSLAGVVAVVGLALAHPSANARAQAADGRSGGRRVKIAPRSG